MKTHEQLVAQALERPGVRAEYERIAPEFELLEAMLRARQAAGLSQEQVAQRMGTKASAVTRLEGALVNGKHSPSLTTLKRYARAVNHRLEIHLIAQ